MKIRSSRNETESDRLKPELELAGVQPLGCFSWTTPLANAALLAAAVLSAVHPAAAQQTIAGKVTKHFSVIPEFFDPPHERQMKSLLEGTEAQQQPDGRFLVHGAKLQRFHEDGGVEMVVESPQCFYDPVDHAVSSSNQIHLTASAGAFSIEGQGFVWQQTNSSVFISNDVHTVIEPQNKEGGSPSLSGTSGASVRPASSGSALPGAVALTLPNSPIDIRSREFSYETATGLGIYREDVRLSGTNLGLCSEVLSVLIPFTNRTVQTLTADRHVVLDYESGHAEGEHATYSVDSGLAELFGNPKWRAEEFEGRGDLLTVDRASGVFRADGHAWLKMPARGKGSTGFIPLQVASRTNSVASTNEFVEVESQSYELRTNMASFRDEVRVLERAGTNVQGTMSCAMLDTAFSQNRELELMAADGGVVIEKGSECLEGGQAIYTADDGLLSMEKNPRWQAGAKEGKGDHITIVVARNEMITRGNAWMKLPASELKALSAPTGANETAQSSRSVKAPAASTATTLANSGGPSKSAAKMTSGARSSKEVPAQFAEITSTEYRFTETAAHFSRDVTISHPEMHWTCENLAVEFSAEQNAVHSIVADERVAFDLTDANGQRVHGTGDRAFYDASQAGGQMQETLTLRGEPAVLERTNAVVQNRVIVLDKTNSKIIASGNYLASAWLPSSATNLLRMPAP